jgi:DNA-binding protein HU-beta
LVLWSLCRAGSGHTLRSTSSKGLGKPGGGEAVNKAELIDAVTRHLGADKRTATHAVEAVVDTITRTVAAGEKVAITGFGVFEKIERGARTARNPATGATVRVKKTSVPKFRPGSNFKDVVSGAKKMAKAADAATKAAAKSAGKTAAKTARTAAAGPGKAASAASKAASKSTAKKGAAKKSTAKTSAAKKTTARKTATKSTAKKAPAKKGAAKKTARR